MSMVWVPITIIAVLIWYVRYLIGLARTTKFQVEYDYAEQKRKALEDIVLDDDLERDIELRFRDEYMEWGKIVQGFMGGGSEWLDYADLHKGFLKAKTVLMLREGKLPRDFVSRLGTELSMWYKSPTAINGNNIAVSKACKMNEEFVIKIESSLNDAGIDAVPLCLPNNGFNEKWIPLHSYLDEHGSGSTKINTHFRFTGK